MNVDGLAAIVTGGASGLGAATARNLAAKGAKVAILDRNEADAKAVAGEIGGVGIACDVSSAESAEAAIAAAQEAGVDPDWARQLIDAAERQQSILDAISRPAEKTKAWYEYRKIFLTDRRIREGATFWSVHADTLQAVAARTGVPAELMVAIIGVETYYGRITGSYRVIDALATLAFD